MAMKVILVMAMVMVFAHMTDGNSCHDRSVKIRMRKLASQTRCSKPHLTVVALPIPVGIDYLTPDVVKINQCTGLSCSVYPERCLPAKTMKQSFQVHGKKINGNDSQCFELMVEEHISCRCGCEDLTCPFNMIFKKETCKCQCDFRQEFLCNYRRDIGDPVMWSRETCSCVCTNAEECGTGIWDSRTCSCMYL